MSKIEVDICSKSVSEWSTLIDEWIYNERDRAIVKRRLLDGICYEPLAEEFDLSVRQVKRVVECSLIQLSKKI